MTESWHELNFVCPYCMVGAGRSCRTMTHPHRQTGYHVQRRDLANAEYKRAAGAVPVDEPPAEEQHQ